MKNLRYLLMGLLALAALTLAACGGGGGGTPAAGPDPTPVTNTTFEATPLGDLAVGTTFSAAVAINHAGLAVGYGDDGTDVNGVRWDVTAVTPVAEILVPLPTELYSSAYGINANGFAVGESSDSGSFSAVFWSAPNAVFVLSNTPQGDPAFISSAAYAINVVGSTGEVVGEAETTGGTVAVYWANADEVTAPVTLANLNPNPAGFSSAYFINEAGVIVGESLNNETPPQIQAVAWVPTAGVYGAPVDLAAIPAQTESVAFGVNLDGHIVGEAEVGGLVYGVVWDTGGALLDTLPAGTSAQAVNNMNRIVGAEEQSAIVWNSTSLTDKNVLAVPFSLAMGINDSNEIVGIGGNNKAQVYIP